MQKNKLNLRICGIQLLNPYKTVVSHLNYSVVLELNEEMMQNKNVGYFC